MELKPCPFCGGEAEEYEKHSSHSNEYYRDPDMFMIRCKTCSANGAQVEIRTFREISPYTVQQFRDNQSLRAKEDDRYDGMVLEWKTMAAINWNTRHAT